MLGTGGDEQTAEGPEGGGVPSFQYSCSRRGATDLLVVYSEEVPP